MQVQFFSLRSTIQPIATQPQKTLISKISQVKTFTKAHFLWGDSKSKHARPLSAFKANTLKPLYATKWQMWHNGNILLGWSVSGNLPFSLSLSLVIRQVNPLLENFFCTPVTLMFFACCRNFILGSVVFEKFFYFSKNSCGNLLTSNIPVKPHFLQKLIPSYRNLLPNNGL